jgi:hypothetical protein
MKNLTLPQPRFTCRLARGALAIFGDTANGPVPRGPGAAHVAACADCQRFFAAGDELDRALRCDAAAEWHESPADLGASILRAVRQSTPPPRPRVHYGLWLSFAGASAAVALAFLVYQRPPPIAPALPPTPVAPTVTTSTSDPAIFAAARQLIAAVPTDLLDEMRPRAEALLAQDPLQNEVEAMESDARSAVRFLALNFLPTPLDQPASGE